VQVTVEITKAMREQGYYQYLPFTVGRDWQSVGVELSYDRNSAVIDLGLIGPDGFCGWSGGARSSVQVAERWATPGYVPVALPGEWFVILGLYQVPDRGVQVSVTVEPGAAGPPPAEEWPGVTTDVPLLERPPSRPGYRWVAGDFHCHSQHSDGSLGLAELAALARGRGLDFLAVTDHNTVSHFPHLEAAGAHYGVALLPGQEVTTPHGHANCIGQVGWADFRTAPDDWMVKAESEGGMASLNHPVLGSLSWSMRLEHQPALVELWHASWDRSSSDALRFWSSLGAPVPVGGSDFHRPGDIDATGAELWPGAPTTWVEVEEDGTEQSPSLENVLAGLRAGAVSISASPTGPVMVRDGDDLVVTGGEGASVVVLSDPSQPLSEVAGSQVSSGRSSLKVGAGVALLMGNGRALALCP
jgi:hypothetical protein